MKSFFILLSIFLCSCTPSLKAGQQSNEEIFVPKALSPEEAEEAMEDVGRSWLYGDGLGTALLNIGTSILYPPYSLFVLGNLALSAAGNEPVGVGMFLEGEDEKKWDRAFSTVVSGPGRMAAAVSGEEYVSPEESKERLLQYTELKIDGVMGEY